MIATFTKLRRFINSKKVICYTLKVSGEYSEFNDFQVRMKSELADLNELAELMRYVDNIVGKWGISKSVEDGCFREEDKAHRFLMPFESYTKTNCEFGLRLYCLILSEKTLVILNGCCKTERWIRDCKKCERYFDFANASAEAIDRDISKGIIGIEANGEIEFDDDYTLYIKEIK